jgi:hypothetical protein
MKKILSLLTFAALLFAVSFIAVAPPASATTTTTQACTKSAVTIVSPLTVTGAHASVSVNAPSGCKVGIASYEASSETFSAQSASKQTLYSHDSVTSTGKLLSLDTSIPDCFYQLDLFVGPLITHLSATNLYSGSLVSSASGGAQSCTAATTTTLAHIGIPTAASAQTSVVKSDTISATVAPQGSTGSTPTMELASKNLAFTGAKVGPMILLGSLLLGTGFVAYIFSVRAARRHDFDYRSDESIVDLP